MVLSCQFKIALSLKLPSFVDIISMCSMLYLRDEAPGTSTYFATRPHVLICNMYECGATRKWNSYNRRSMENDLIFACSLFLLCYSRMVQCAVWFVPMRCCLVLSLLASVVLVCLICLCVCFFSAECVRVCRGGDPINCRCAKTQSVIRRPNLTGVAYDGYRVGYLYAGDVIFCACGGCYNGVLLACLALLTSCS